jgi:hypothetical protein
MRQSAMVLALATLDDATQIGSFLFTSRLPRWPRKVRKVQYRPQNHWHYCAKFHQCKHSLSGFFGDLTTNRNYELYVFFSFVVTSPKEANASSFTIAGVFANKAPLL